MPNIQCLDPHVADLIAAGEVVERPASVVKELMENAIDAGASVITVEIQRGGMSYIRVTDNGCGIAPEDAETAFLRHATSKIRSERDLEAIGTLGFRGEALAAIAAVSHVELLTRTQDSPFGTSLLLDGGVVRERDQAGCPQGTTLIVRSLFYNTPARLKFIKRDATEGAAVCAVVQHAALSHPEISFRLLRDGKQDLLTPGDNQLKSALYAVLGRDIALGFLPCKGSGEELSVEGFVSSPSCCRGSRSYQHFFVNGRYVKSRTMTAALEEAYKNTKMVGKFPGCVLHITTRLNAVDVNVHPTKTEVKFTNERKLYDAVYYAVCSALGQETRHPQVTLQPPPARQTGQTAATPNFFRTLTAQQYRSGNLEAEGQSRREPTQSRRQTRGGAVTPKPAVKPKAPFVVPRPFTEVLAEEQAVQSSAKPADVSTEVENSVEIPPVSAPKPAPEPVSVAEAAETLPQETLLPEPEVAPWRLVGEVLDTYLIVEQGERLILIDKHAAHERMKFDKLKAQDYQPMRQMLLTPLVFTPAPEEGAALLAQLELLQRFGFEVEDFGGGALLVRQAPDYLGVDQIEPTLTELAGKLLVTGTADPQAARDEVLHTMACKSAIKGGWKNDPQELEVVAQAVLSGQVKYCPHGRPVAVELTRKQLEKQFKRS